MEIYEIHDANGIMLQNARIHIIPVQRMRKYVDKVKSFYEERYTYHYVCSTEKTSQQYYYICSKTTTTYTMMYVVLSNEPHTVLPIVNTIQHLV